MKKIIILLIMLLLILFGLNSNGCGDNREKPSADTTAFIKWAAEHAIPINTYEPGNGFNDLLPIKDIVGNAKIVCLGESKHDIREQFKFKHRMVEFLVTELGFTTFILEESFPYSREIDSYLQTGNGDPGKLLANTPMWFIWNTEEILDMIKWMRNYNADSSHKRKIRFFGMDVTSPLSGMKVVREYLERVDPSFSRLLQKRRLGLELFDDNDWSVTMRRFGTLSAEEKQIINGNYDYMVGVVKSRRSRYISVSSVEEYRWVLRLAEVGRDGCRLFSASSYVEGGVIRDRAMADNVKWIMRYCVPGERVIIWAANPHIGREETYMPDRFGREGLVSVGCWLNEKMSGEMVTVAAAFTPGGKGGVGMRYFDDVLGSVGLDLFILDLRGVPVSGAVARWLKLEHRMRGQDADILCVPGGTFDAVYFINSASRTVPRANRPPAPRG